MKKELKNYGLSISKDVDPKAYVIGAVELPKIILKADGQWDQWLPTYEPQFNEYFDTFGCTVWGSLNAIEILVKRITNAEKNYSERFNYIIAKIVPPGADPHTVLESIREHGVIDEIFLPFLSSMRRADFLKPNPMTQELLEKGMTFGYEVQHQYLWPVGKTPARDERMAIMKEHLRYSPLPITVTAWMQDVENGPYVDDGQPNTHWCVCFGWNQKGDAWYDPKLPEGWKIFDSYEQSVKIVSFDHHFEVGKRLHLELNNYLPKLSLIGRILAKISQLIAQMFPSSTVPPAPLPSTSVQPSLPPEPTPAPQPAPTPTVEPPKSKLEDWGHAIETFEGAPKQWNNPGAIRGLDGKFIQFASYAEGWKYLLNYLTRAATGKHRAYPKGGETTLIEFQRTYSPSSDNNNPTTYATFIAGRLGVTLDTKIKNLI